MEAYLRLLGIELRGEVDGPALARLQRAHVLRVPYETVDLVRGAPPGIDPTASIDRVLAGRGGYCYHLNGAFSELLDWLGVDVTRHLAGVQGRSCDLPPGADGNHLGLTVGTADGHWLVDVGLGDGPAEPLPLRTDEHVVDGCRYALRPSATDPGGWRFEHEPGGGFAGFDLAPDAVGLDAFAEMHQALSTRSRFAQVVTVQRRTEAGHETLRGCVFTERTPAGRSSQELTREEDWWGLVIDGFGLAYADLGRGERAALWGRVLDEHRAWDAAGRP